MRIQQAELDDKAQVRGGLLQPSGAVTPYQALQDDLAKQGHDVAFVAINASLLSFGDRTVTSAARQHDEPTGNGTRPQCALIRRHGSGA